MGSNTNYGKQAFAEVVSVEAWHSEYNESVTKVDLYIDVVFKEARVGGESESPVQFRLSLKRATIVVVIPETEPVTVIKSSVSRDAPEFSGSKNTKVIKTDKTHAQGGAAVSTSLTKSAAQLDVAAGKKTEYVKEEEIKTSETINLILVTHSKTFDGHNKWDLRSGTEDKLSGRPWRDHEKRLTLLDQRKDGSSIPPVVRVEARCLKEDLIIQDIKPNNETLWMKFKEKSGSNNRMKAAEAYIRTKLCEEGFEIEALDKEFSSLVLSNIIASHEPS